MAEINLARILDIGELDDYKLHLAMDSGEGQPLDDYIKDNAGPGKVGDRWTGWQEYRKKNDRWKNCKYILSFIRVYPEGNDIWLFGGIFEKLDPDKGSKGYKIEKTEQGREYRGRLKISYHNRKRNVYRKLETVYSELKVHELLSEPYSGTLFIRYENISLDFPQIASIIKANQKDWRTALVNHKGIDVIFR